ncbi:hypothetical protein [Rhodophyticola porphyridii]|uniref:hypothetical protein n=1 Tax=Rhodophyticola porphyridii TaxID=1852017 RepID=UPI0013146349|nr:hypothetical protein [Rhodophyticola porphyridii]
MDWRDSWLLAYVKWVGAYLALSVALGVLVFAWGRVDILPDDPRCVPSEDVAAP